MGFVQSIKDWHRGTPKPKPRNPSWDKLASSVVKRSGRCAACGSKSKLEVHHKKPFHLYPELEMIETNLMVLCRVCHYLFGHFCDWKAWNPHVDLDVGVISMAIRARIYVRSAA